MSATHSSSHRDLLLALVLLAAFPAAMSLTDALSEDGSGDHTVPFVRHHVP